MRRTIGLLVLAAALAAPAGAVAAPPSISAGDVSVIEGDSGKTTTAHFTLTLSAPSSSSVTVDYATADGTATAPADYASTTGTATFPVGSTTTEVDVPVRGDAIDENDETFTLHLSNPSGAGVAAADGTGTILDDDPVPTISAGDTSVTEANTETRAATFTVRLSTASERTVLVHYATADAGATAGADYQPAAGDLSFAAGTTTRTVSVRVLPDTIDEPTEQFKLVLSSPVNAVIADGTGVASIFDNDPQPFISVGDTRVREGAPAVFTVTLSHVSGRTVSAAYATASGSAQSGVDFVAATGRVTIAPGAISARVFVPTFDDGIHEPTEFFTIGLSRPSNVGIRDAHGTAVILDNDRAPRPVVRALTVRPVAFRALRSGGSRASAPRGGARVRYRLSRAASAHVGIERVRSNGSITRLRGGFSVASHAGLNAFRFSGRLAGHRLRAGRYRLVLVAVGRDGGRSPPSRVAFRIVP